MDIKKIQLKILKGEIPTYNSSKKVSYLGVNLKRTSKENSQIHIL